MLSAERAPFPLGTSPFHIKGHSYRAQIEYCAEHVPGGFDAVLAAIETPGYREFFAQNFRTSSWYDVLPSLVLGEAGAVATGVTVREFSMQLADAAAKRDISGLYRMLLKFASSDTIVERHPKVASQYFDFVDATSRKVGPREYESTIVRVPTLVAESYRCATEAFLSEALRASGARNVQQVWSEPTPDRPRMGCDTVTIHRVIRWSAPR